MAMQSFTLEQLGLFLGVAGAAVGGRAIADTKEQVPHGQMLLLGM
jgi:hypothetical protein